MGGGATGDLTNSSYTQALTTLEVQSCTTEILTCSCMAVRINIKVNCREGILVFVEKGIVQEDFFLKAQVWEKSMRVTVVQENLKRSPVDKTEYI